MDTIRVLLADDHALVRLGFRGLLSSLQGVEVVAEAADGREALELIRVHRPDVALVDIAMPDINGLELTARVASEFSKTRVIVLSMHESEEYALRALQAGVSGYLLKSASLAEFETAIRAVGRGETYFCPAVSKHITEHLRRGGGPVVSRYDSLTPRQREILQLIAEGHSTKQIAKRLGIKLKTAVTHRTQLMDRLDLHSVAEVVRFAIQAGVIQPGDRSRP
jgi:DNA-binding NarL/FixJ family response regulator